MKKKTCLIVSLVLLSFLLLACKEVLYSNLVEQEANEIIAILVQRGIGCEKGVGSEENKWNVTIDENDFGRAIDILKAYGYPRQQFQSIGDVFQQTGIVSSPLVDRIRFIYAVSQGLESTITNMDGVVVAKVHTVIPHNNPLSDHIIPSSASVFVKYRPGANLQNSIPKIKELVVNSIEGLTYDKVTVVLSEGDNPLFFEPTEMSYKQVLGVKVAKDSVNSLYLLIAGVAGLFLVMAAGATVLLIHELGKRKKEKEAKQ